MEGKRPQTRGVAMNPVDHSHGGGEGKLPEEEVQSHHGDNRQKFKTRRPKRSDNLIISRRKKRNK